MSQTSTVPLAKALPAVTPYKTEPEKEAPPTGTAEWLKEVTDLWLVHLHRRAKSWATAGPRADSYLAAGAMHQEMECEKAILQFLNDLHGFTKKLEKK
jgi:hypothetical protein